METPLLKQRALDVHGSRYDYSKTKWSTSWSQKVTITCPEHGDFQQTMSNHVANQRGCPECGGSKPHDTAWFVREARRIHGSKYDYSKVKYQNCKTPVTITCPTHGDFQQPSMKHITRGFGCPICAGRRTTHALWVKAAQDLHGDEYDYSKVKYRRSLDYVTITCHQHGDFRVTASNHTNPLVKSRCPKCTYKLSSPHKVIADILEKLNVGFVLNTRRVLPDSRELDIYLPEHKLAIEVNGVYWHSEALGKDRNYHYRKTVLAKRAGIQLLHLWDFEIWEKLDLVRSMIQQRLGMSKRLYARELVVDREVPSDETRKFLAVNHLQGPVNAKMRYGLRAPKSGKLACLMTFGKPRFDQSQSGMELLRFACAQGITVVGGASRLLAAFRKDHPAEDLVSYADLRHSQGNLYRQLGFKFSHRSLPNYFWVGNNQKLPRYSTQKHKLPELLGDSFDPQKSALVNMESAGFTRVFDCGNLVFRLPVDPLPPKGVKYR